MLLAALPKDPINRHLINPVWLGSRVVSVLDSDAERPGFKSLGRPNRVSLGPIPLINPVFSFYLFLYGTYYSDFTYCLFFVDSADTAGSVNQSVSSCFLSTTLVVQSLNRSINV